MNAPAFAVVPEKPVDDRYRLLSADDLAQAGSLRWLVKGVLPDQGLAAIYGPPGSGKTFLVLDLAASVARGKAWFERRTKACPVVYLALEGEHGIANRVRAYKERHGEHSASGVYFVTETFSLLDIRDVPALVEAIRRGGADGGLVIIDTLNRAAGGADENSAQDMGALIASCSELQRELGGLVLLVHHSGKDAARGARGHSSLFAALDAAIEVSRSDAQREWKLAKSKDGEDGKAHPFELQVVELGIDEDGDMATSCVVEPCESVTGAIRKAASPGGGNMRLAFDAISDALKASPHYGKGSAPPIRPCIELEAAMDAVGPRLPVEPKRQRERACAAITSLAGRGCIEFREGWIWLP